MRLAPALALLAPAAGTAAVFDAANPYVRFWNDVWANHFGVAAAVCAGLALMLALTLALIVRNRQLQAARLATREAERRWVMALDGAGHGVWDWNVAQDSVYYSKQWSAMLGHAETEIGEGLDEWKSRVHPDDLESVLQAIQAHLDGDTPCYRSVYRLRAKDGRYRWVLDSGTVFRRSANGKPLRVVGTHTDITHMRETEAALQKTSFLYRELVQNMSDGVAIYEAVDDGNDFRIVALNPAGARSAARDADEVIGRLLSEAFPGAAGMGLIKALRRVYRSGKAEALRTARYADERVSIWVENYIYKLPTGEVVAVFEDVSERMAAQQTLLQTQADLKRMAYFDPLTGLANRRLLRERLEQAILSAKRNDTWLAVCYLDLDGFKPVNDQFGHAIGDTLLKSVAERFDKIIRGTDLAARWGGDEFTLLLTGLRNLHECEETVSRLIHQLAEPHRVKGRSLTLSASIGVALYPYDSSDGDTLLRHADHAMYLAKQRGRNTYQFFDPVTDNFHSERYDQQRRTQSGIENGEMGLVYQPIVDMRIGGVVGVEALVRWHCPQRGELGPIAFLPAIEGTAVIRLLDLWVLRQSLSDLSAWGDAGAGLRMHVNLSAHSLVSESFIDDVQAALEPYPTVSASQLVLEIIETAALEDLDAVSGVIRQGSALGLTFALDDFGTGYSSLTYFRHLPAELLKIDRSFVQDMLRDENDLRIVEAVIGLAAAFDRTVIAEGIESEGHGTNLLRLGCELGQGFAIAPPMPSDAVSAWIEGYRQPPRWRSVSTRPWLHRDLPLMTMEAEHRSWLDAVLAYLHASAPVEAQKAELSEDACDFGRWYHGEGDRRYGGLQTFRDLAPLHRRVHRLAIDLVAQKARGGKPTAGDMRALEEASAELIDCLASLQRELPDSAREAG